VVRGEVPTGVRPGRATVQLPTSGITSVPRRLPPARQRQPLVWAAGILILVGIAVGAFLARGLIGQGVPATPTSEHAGSSAMTDPALPIDDDFSKGAAGKYAPWVLVSTNSSVRSQYTASTLRIQNTLRKTAIATVVDPQAAAYSDPYVVESTMTISTDSQAPS